MNQKVDCVLCAARQQGFLRHLNGRDSLPGVLSSIYPPMTTRIIELPFNADTQSVIPLIRFINTQRPHPLVWGFLGTRGVENADIYRYVIHLTMMPLHICTYKSIYIPVRGFWAPEIMYTRYTICCIHTHRHSDLYFCICTNRQTGQDNRTPGTTPSLFHSATLSQPSFHPVHLYIQYIRRIQVPLSARTALTRDGEPQSIPEARGRATTDLSVAKW